MVPPLELPVLCWMNVGQCCVRGMNPSEGRARDGFGRDRRSLGAGVFGCARALEKPRFGTVFATSLAAAGLGCHVFEPTGGFAFLGDYSQSRPS